MKIKNIILIIAFIFFVSEGVSFAGCEENVWVDSGTFEQFKEALNASFPFSLVLSSYDFMNDLSMIEGESPAGWSITLFGTEYAPLEFLASDALDSFMVAVRYIMIAMAVLGIVRHLMEYVL
jgi:hypothetical protein